MLFYYSNVSGLLIIQGPWLWILEKRKVITMALHHLEKHTLSGPNKISNNTTGYWVIWRYWY